MSINATSDPPTPESTPEPTRALATSGDAGSNAAAPAANPLTGRSATFLGAAILAVVTLAYFQMLTRHPFDLLVGPQRGDGGNDLTAYYMGSQSVGRISCARFRELPRWNPHAATGGPWWGNPQSGCWYPPNWIFYVCSAGGTLGWMMIAHQWWGGFGVYLLSRRLGFSPLIALVGGGLYIAAPYNVAHLGEGHYGQICVVSWIPWALLAYERFRHDPIGGLPRVAMVLALSVLAGHVQEAYYLAIVLTWFAGIDALHRLSGQGWRAAAQFSARWCCVGALTGALVAIDFVPCWAYAKQSLRGYGLTGNDSTQGGLSLSNLWQLLDPNALGGPGSYRGSGEFYWESLTHFGLVTLLLAALGAGLSLRRHPVRRYAWLGLIAFGFAFGGSGPVYWLVRALVPGITLFRGPNRALFFCAAVIPVLSAAGLEVLVRMTRLAPGRAAMRTPSRLSRGGRVGRPLAWLGIGWLIVLGMLELGLHAHDILRTAPPASFRRDGPAVDFLQERAGYHRILAEQRLLSDREALQAGLYKVHGYEPVSLTRYAVAMFVLNGLREPNSLILGFDAIDLSGLHRPVLDLLGVRYAVVGPTDQVDWTCWNVLQRGSMPGQVSVRGQAPAELEYWILENQNALPRAFVVGEARILRSGEDSTRALSELNPRREVLLAKDLLSAGARSGFQPAHILEYRANRVTVEVTLQRPGYLVLTDTWYPGWTAEDDGTPVELVPANVFCRAVPLGAGRHTVVFRYGWSGYLGGMMLSALALVLAIRVMIRKKPCAAAGLPRGPNQLPC
jgi:hypothetical protein